MNTHTKGIEQCHHGLLTEEAGGFRPRAPPAPPVGGAWAWGSRRLGLGAEGRSAWEEGGGALFLLCLSEPAALGRGRCGQLSHRL